MVEAIHNDISIIVIIMSLVLALFLSACTQETQDKMGRSIQNWTGTNGVLDIYYESGYHINTTPRDPAELEPLLNDFHKDLSEVRDILGNIYPLKYVEMYPLTANEYCRTGKSLNQTFFTYLNNLTITSFNNADFFELLANDLMHYNEFNGDINVLNTFNASEHNFVSGDSLLEVPIFDCSNCDCNAQGDNKICLNHQYNYVNNLGFKLQVPIDEDEYLSGLTHAQGKRTEHGSYSKFYVVTAIQTQWIDDNQIMIYTIDAPLEADLDINKDVSIYNYTFEPYSSDYVELQMNNVGYKIFCDLNNGGNLYDTRIKSYFEGSSSFIETSAEQIFVDTEAPTLLSIFPQGTCSNLTPEIGFYITEDSCGSGIDLENSYINILDSNDDEYREISLSDILVNISDSFSGIDVIYEFIYSPDTLDYESFENGEYTIIVNAYDYAKNLVLDNTWILNIDDSASTAPLIEVTNANPEYGFWNNIFFVAESPLINITFVEEVNLIDATLVYEEFSEIIFALICDSENNMAFECVVDYSGSDSSIFNKLLTINISAEKIDLEGSPILDSVGCWFDKQVIYDSISPDFEGELLPLAMQPEGEFSWVNFMVALEEPELDIIVNISEIGTEEYYVLSGLSSNNDNLNYSAILNASYFNWQSLNNYQFNITVFDRAMNTISKNYSIWVDNIPPKINITEFKSNGVNVYPEELNLTTNNANISITGSINDSAIKHICLNVSSDVTDYPEIDCQYPCDDGETLNCITEDNLFTFNFSVSFESDWQNQELVWNYIELVATDEALNKADETLTTLLDLQPPIVGRVNVE